MSAGTHLRGDELLEAIVYGDRPLAIQAPTTTYDTEVGVVIGRFQVPRLTDGQYQLIRHVIERHDQVVIYVGESHLPSTTHNPLSVAYRVDMIRKMFPSPKITVRSIKDHKSDKVWSSNLDLDLTNLNISKSFRLYGSRDSFIPGYFGVWPTELVPSIGEHSGSALRQAIIGHPEAHNLFGAGFGYGAVWAAGQRFPTVYTTVDAIILNEDGTEVLLGSKPGAIDYCLIGGFAEPDSLNDEEDVHREVDEETGLKVTIERYVGNFQVADWRYRSEADTIRTRLYVVCALPGQTAVAADDIESVAWFPIDEVPLYLQDCHQPLWEAFIASHN